MYPLGIDRQETQTAILIQKIDELLGRKVDYTNYLISGEKSKPKELSGQDLEDYILKQMG